jgi:cell division protein FtsN
MEKQKIFWVVLSVSVFVVVVLLVGVFLLRQKPATSVVSAPGTVNPLSDVGTQVYEYQVPAQQPGAQQPGTQQPGGSQTMHFYIGEGSQKPAQDTQTPPTTPSAGAADAPATPAHPAPAAPAASLKAPVAKAQPTPRSAQKTLDYWIQTGSYKSQTRAEELVSLLADKGLSGRVFSVASHADTFYRVRIGPYSNKGEAQKFLSIVKQIQGLETSYISMVSATAGHGGRTTAN